MPTIVLNLTDAQAKSMRQRELTAQALSVRAATQDHPQEPFSSEQLAQACEAYLTWYYALTPMAKNPFDKPPTDARGEPI